MIQLNSYLDISSISNGYTHTFQDIPKKARYLWTFIFGFLTKDLNPVHINPVTFLDYKSKLGGLSRHGISTLAQAESFIFKLIQFTSPTEILAKGYNKVRYLRPVNIGDTLVYTYTLLEKKINTEKGHAECTFEVSATNHRGEKVFIAEWIVLYCYIEENHTNLTSVIPLTGGVMQMNMTVKEYRKFIIYMGLLYLFFLAIACLMVWHAHYRK